VVCQLCGDPGNAGGPATQHKDISNEAATGRNVTNHMRIRLTAPVIFLISRFPELKMESLPAPAF
jgi:hypothetical protein